MKRVAVLYGGRSTEHEVSCVSGATVLRALDASPRLAPLVIGVDRAGRWTLQALAHQRAAASAGALTIEPGATLAVRPACGILDAAGRAVAVDCVFPVVHGRHGEDGEVQGLLESASLPYTGSEIAASALGFDKARTKVVLREAGLPVVDWILLDRLTATQAEVDAFAAQALDRFGLPLFVKPNRSGSSVGIGRVDDQGQLRAAIERARQFDTGVLIEPGLDVRELEVAIVGNDEVQVFEPGEVIPHRQFYDYEAKYVDPAGADFAIPAELSPRTLGRVARLSERAYRALGLAGYARIDCFMERGGDRLYISEVNTLPGLTPASLFPRMADHGGLPFVDAVERLVDLAIERHRIRDATVTQR